MSFRFVSKQRKPPTLWGCLFDILITSKGASALGMCEYISKLSKHCNNQIKGRDVQTSECKANKRPNTSQRTQQTDGQKCKEMLVVQVGKSSLSGNSNNAKNNVDSNLNAEVNIQPTNLVKIEIQFCLHFTTITQQCKPNKFILECLPRTNPRRTHA